MKRVLLIASVLFAMTELSTSAATTASQSAFVNEMQDDYCPKGYICEATNLKATPIEGGNVITGVSVYKNRFGRVIAIVPGHGQLSCYWREDKIKYLTGWYFDANNRKYQIQGYNRK